MKLAEAITMLLSHLLLFTCIVLTVWLPANLLVEYLAYQSLDADQALINSVRLNMWISGIFGPITAGAVVYAAAQIKQGQAVTYFEAMGVGLRCWLRLFAARLVAGILIALGLILLIVPGIYLSIRWGLLDAVVVLEDAGVSDSRSRSGDLVQGRKLRILGAAFFFLTGFFVLAFVIALPLEFAPSLDTFVFAAAVDCVLDVVYTIIGIAMFLFYWEARQEESGALLPDAADRQSETETEEVGAWEPRTPDDGNPYRPPGA